jgi:ABC-type phosphate transport system substrate-binding protein
LVFLLLLGALLTSQPSPPAEGRVAVIVNVKNETPPKTPEDVARLFLKKTQHWPDGLRVRPIDRSGNSSERAVFLAEVLRLSDEGLKRYWVEAQYQNGVAPPPRVKNSKDVIELVGAYRGAIGFVSVKDIEAAPHPDVVVVAVFPIQQ